MPIYSVSVIFEADDELDSYEKYGYITEITKAASAAVVVLEPVPVMPIEEVLDRIK